MARKTMLAPSVFAADLGTLREQVAELEAKGVELLHFDVMDGQFVERVAFGADHLSALRAMTKLPIEAHLMVERPECCLDSMVAAGADTVVIHQESTTRVLSCLHKIRAGGAKAGIALSPATSEETLRYVLDDLDKILLMTVNPGEGGQHFLDSVVEKIRRTRDLIGDREIDIEVDGSIDAKTIATCFAAGANAFVSGGYLFKGSVADNIDALRDALASPFRLV
ncbi:ribulose-phosphate 3-epimerase [Streptomyces sp. YIM S03343]